jgi:hypothetical protein
MTTRRLAAILAAAAAAANDRDPLLEAFRSGMAARGFVEGQTFVIEARFAAA